MNYVQPLLLAGGLSLTACVGPGIETRERLPFHVALIPTTSLESAPSQSLNGPRISLDARRVDRLLCNSLEAGLMTRATLLPPPDPGTWERLGPRERDAYWINAAVDAHADLLIECELDYDPLVEFSRNEKFWLNLPLFLLGGPMCYFVDDSTYRARATLTGRLWDINPIVAGRADLEDGGSLLADVSSKFSSANLDFLDRAGTSPWSYAASLVVPPGLLAHGSTRAIQSLTSEVESGLVHDLSSNIAEQSEALRSASRIASFHLDSDIRVSRSGDRAHVLGHVVLRAGSEVDRLEGWKLTVGERAEHGEFVLPKPDGSQPLSRHSAIRFPLSAEIGLGENDQEVRLEVIEAGPTPVTRTFTFRIGQGPAANRDACSQATLRISVVDAAADSDPAGSACAVPGRAATSMRFLPFRFAS